MMSFAETIAPAEAMSVSILKRSPIGSNLEDYGVLSDGVLIDLIFLSPTAPDRQTVDVEAGLRLLRRPHQLMGTADAR
jgi:hypothetical protein